MNSEKKNVKRKYMHFCTYASLHLFTVWFLLFTLICAPVFAAELDTSVNDEIRKNYNPDKLEDDVKLPSLPKIITEEEHATKAVKSQVQPLKPVSSNTPIKAVKSVTPAQPVQQAKIQQSESFSATNTASQSQESEQLKQISAPMINSSSAKMSYAVLKSGTKLDLKLLTSVSDRTRHGTIVKLVSMYPVSTTYYTVPMGTVFYGRVEDSHHPQLLTNGGLIVIGINAMEIAGNKHQIDAIVTKVNSKHIYFNNIKGERRYFKSMRSSMKPGFHFLKKMMGVTGNLMTDGSSIVVAPFSLCAGVIAAGGNVLLSPALALFRKGAPIYVNNGSYVQIKLQEDVRIYSN